MQGVADEIAERAAAVGRARLPAPHAHARRVILDVPGHHHVAERADRAVVDQRLGFAPRRNFREAEIDHGRRTAGGLPQHGRRAVQVDGEGLFDEHRLAACQRAHRDRRLQAGRGRDCDRVDLGVLHKLLPAAECTRHCTLTRDFGGARRVGAGKRNDRAARIGAKCRQQDAPAIVATHDAQTDHGRCRSPRRNAITRGNLAGCRETRNGVAVNTEGRSSRETAFDRSLYPAASFRDG